ncbi:MAG: hypothetical protein LUC16_01520 [Coprobacillus sp.]|nr:hypothetical protein [Coprobacillus sp.]
MPLSNNNQRSYRGLISFWGGIFLILLSIVLILNTWYIARTLTYVFTYSFGIMSYVLYGFIYATGFIMAFFKDKFHISYKIRILAVVLLFIGLMMLITCIYITVNGAREVTKLGSFASYFGESCTGFGYYSVKWINLFSKTTPFAGGFFGYLLVGLFTYVGSYIISIILILGGIVLLFYPEIKRVFIRRAENAPTPLKVESEEEIESRYLGATDIAPSPSYISSAPEQYSRYPHSSSYYNDNNDENSHVAYAPFMRKKSIIEESPSPKPSGPVEPLRPSFTSTHINHESSSANKASFINYDDNVIEESRYSDEEEEYSEEEDYMDILPSAIAPNRVEPIIASRPVAPSPAPIVTPEVITPAPTPNVYVHDASENTIIPETPKVRERINFVPPPIDLLKDYPKGEAGARNVEYAERRKESINKLLSKKTDARVNEYIIGPTFTRFIIDYGEEFSVKTIANAMSDIAIAVGGASPRFVPTIPGTQNSGIEVPNPDRVTVGYKDMIAALPPTSEHPLAVPFGVDVVGTPIYADFSDFPHALVAGTTGSGKTVYVQSVITTLIMRNSPDDVKMVIIDPKRVDMMRFEGIPHLLCPIISEVSQVKVCLEKLIAEMEDRYIRLQKNDNCPNIKAFNKMAAEKGLDPMPYICVFIDEYADLATNREYGKENSVLVLRLAQKARACGIHLLVATQRPDTSIITGTLKGNLATHVTLKMANFADSNTIIGGSGAEKLLGQGDMLVQYPGLNLGDLTRLQGCYLEDKEIDRIVNYLKSNYETVYDATYLDLVDHSKDEGAKDVMNGAYGEGEDDMDDELYEMVRDGVMKDDYTSMSKIRADYSVGFNRARRLFTRLQQDGIVSTSTEGGRGSKVLVHELELDDDGDPIIGSEEYATHEYGD